MAVKDGNRTGSCTRIPVWRAQSPELLDDAVVGGVGNGKGDGTCTRIAWMKAREPELVS